MELEAVIGLEIHVQLKTVSKMFCACPNIFGDVEANTAVCPICLGYPGTLPVPNKTAIEWTQRTGAALNCQLPLKSKFDRKSYFYPDLPKGYQISQFDEPFCQAGGLEIVVDGQRHSIRLERIHLEEDAAKNTHPQGANYTLVDYNRAGTPLMEIVTKPDLRSPEEAKIFLQELQRTLRSLGVSDADMEKGQMRCDANISLTEKGSTKLHPKTEIKNINSFRFVAKGLAYEISRQTKLWQKGNPPQVSSTRGWDADQGVTTEQRVKEEAADYRYFPEPDIPPFEFSSEKIAEIRASIPELPGARQTRLMRQYGLKEEKARLFVEEQTLGNFFEAVVSELEQLGQEQVNMTQEEVLSAVKLATNLIARQLRQLIVEESLSADQLNISAENFSELTRLVQEGKVSQQALSRVLSEMQKTGGDPEPIITQLGVAQLDDSEALEEHVNEVIAANPEVVEKIKAGKEGAIQFLMGQVMARTKGTANPGEVVKLLREKLL